MEIHKDPTVALQKAISLYADISSLDNKWLTREATEEEILQAVK